MRIKRKRTENLDWEISFENSRTARAQTPFRFDFLAKPANPTSDRRIREAIGAYKIKGFQSIGLPYFGLAKKTGPALV